MQLAVLEKKSRRPDAHLLSDDELDDHKANAKDAEAYLGEYQIMEKKVLPPVKQIPKRSKLSRRQRKMQKAKRAKRG